MKPTIGRIVHIMTSENKIWPAIIIEAKEAKMTVQIFDGGPGGTSTMTFTGTAMVSAVGPKEAEAGQWWWPERI